MARPDTGARKKLLTAALGVIREQGYSATSVEELCAVAGVTKGAFFHHFQSKEALAVAAAEHWSQTTGSFFDSAPYHGHKDPVDRLLGYIDFRKDILGMEVPQFTCLVGTMVQETYGSHPRIREACEESISGHAAKLVPDMEAAMRARGLEGSFSAESLALYTQAVIQGAFILAKAKGGAAAARDCLDHLKMHLELLFGRRVATGKAASPELTGGDIDGKAREQ